MATETRPLWARGREGLLGLVVFLQLRDANQLN